MAIGKQTALVYCEDQFGLVDGKTAAGLVRHSETYQILGVIDSRLVGQDAGVVLDDRANGIPIFANLADALAHLSQVPTCYIYGKAPLDACIPAPERLLILEAMRRGMNIINGLHQFFSDDREFARVAAQCAVQIKDIRKPPKLTDLHVFTGDIDRVTVPVIAILGTDCACGKMTTAVELNNALNALGLKSVMIATGQTSLMQGAKYGASMDALVSQFAIGEIEHAVIQAFDHEQPDIILVEGQSAVSHPAFMSSIGILKGAMPDAVILQHPPARKYRCDFPTLLMPVVETEIQLIEAISTAQVIAITLSHEDLTAAEIPPIIRDYESRFGLPTTDVLTDGCLKLIRALADRFPDLAPKLAAGLIPDLAPRPILNLKSVLTPMADPTEVAATRPPLLALR
jgi:uncharacterized NAD-dependent epimerase/dehydratase family protein